MPKWPSAKPVARCLLRCHPDPNWDRVNARIGARGPAVSAFHPSIRNANPMSASFHFARCAAPSGGRDAPGNPS
jgi:hypothetical protein